MNLDHLQRNFGCKLSIGLLVVLLCLFLSGSLSAQVDGTGGPLVSVDYEAVCDDGTTAFAVFQQVVGISGTTLLGYVDAAGAAYTLSGGTLTAGACGGSQAVAPTSNPSNIQILALCDDGTPFYRVAVYNDTTSALSASADFELDLSTSYTPSGTVYAGPCSTTQAAVLTRTVSTTTGTIPVGALSWEICNEGTANATITVGGSTTTLIPGSCMQYAGSYNYATRVQRTSPAITYDATNTSLAVVTEF